MTTIQPAVYKEIDAFPPHPELMEGLISDKYRISIAPSAASRAVMRGLTGKKGKNILWLWVVIGWSLIFSGVYIAFVEKSWIALAAFVGGFICGNINHRTNQRTVMQHIVNADMYAFLLQQKGIAIFERQDDAS